MRIGFWFDYDQTFTFVKLFEALRRRLPETSASGFVVNAEAQSAGRPFMAP